jgi:hypothetical protein
MLRKTHIEFACAFFPIITRGYQWQKIFNNPADRADGYRGHEIADFLNNEARATVSGYLQGGFLGSDAKKMMQGMYAER